MVEPTTADLTTSGSGDDDGATASSPEPLPPYIRPPWDNAKEFALGETGAVTASTTSSDATPRELLGRATREFNPASVVEAELAASLFQRQVVVPVPPALWDLENGTALEDAAISLELFVGDGRRLWKDLERLTSAYDRSAFMVEHPAPPVSVANIVLTTIVFIFEIGALLSLWLTTKWWGTTNVASFVAVLALGGVSLSVVLALAVQEAVGDVCRPVTTRNGLHAAFTASVSAPANGSAQDLTGAVVVLEESVIVHAATTYRPTRLRWVAIGVCLA